MKAVVSAALLLLLAGLASAATFTVTNTNSAGPGSYGQAIIDANAAPGSTIAFAIPGTPPFTLTDRAVFTVPVTVDGTTQPGYAPGSPAIRIERAYIQSCPLVTYCAGGPAAFELSGGFTSIRGLEILISNGNAIDATGDGYSIESNVIGRVASPHRLEGYGVVLSHSRSSTVSANRIAAGRGVVISGGSGNVVSGNDLRGSFFAAISVTSMNNTIGGSGPGDGNLADGAEGSPAIQVVGDGNVIQGNTVANASHGIHVDGNGNLVGGAVTAAANTVHASGYAIHVIGSRNGLHRNSLYDINVVAIEVDGNNDQAAPILTSAITSGSNTVVSGSLTAAPGTYSIEFFESGRCGPEARTFLDTATVTVPPPSGEGGFTVTLPALPVGSFVTATATDTLDNTSELSNCQNVGTSSGPPPAISHVGAAFPGARVVIEGSNFANVTSVTIVGLAASFEIISASRIEAVVPIDAAGNGEVVVTAPTGVGRHVIEVQSVIRSISPDSGPTSGGTSVTIEGDGFGDGTTVSFGETTVVPVSATRHVIVVNTPPHAAGPVAVLIRQTDGPAVARQNGFTYVSATPCTPLQLVERRGEIRAFSGQVVNVCLAYDGSGPVSIQWFEGVTGDPSSPVSGATTDCIFWRAVRSTTLWARISNACSVRETPSIQIVVTAGRPRPARR